MAQLPCKNPSCGSYGQPHPHCRCYSDMAEGGEVGFCTRDRMHEKGCQYYAEGGNVSFDDMEDYSGKSAPKADTSFDDMEDYSNKVAPKNNTSFDDMQDYSNKYSTTGQKILTGAEGLAHGFAGPLADLAETKLLGIPAGEIAGRQAANPGISTGSELAGTGIGLYTGVGEAGLLMKGAEAASELANVSKAGAAILKGFISSGAMQTSDEVSKMILGQSDPGDAVGAKLARIGFSGLIGSALGGVGSKVESFARDKLKNIAENKLGEHIIGYLSGLGLAADPSKAPNIDLYRDKASPALRKSFDKGVAAFKQLIPASVPPSVGAAVGGYEGYKDDGIVGGAEGALKGLLGGIAVDIAKPIIGKASAKILSPAILKIAQSGVVKGSLQAIDHAVDVAHGSGMVDKWIENLFKTAPIASQKVLNELYPHSDIANIKDYLIGGGPAEEIQQKIYQDNAAPPEGYAEGGTVEKKEINPLKENDGMAIHYPEHDMLQNMAKGRIAGYLNTLRPPDKSPKLTFDAEPDMRDQEKKYNKALHLAARPLAILDQIKNGTISGEDVKSFNAMYPELNNLLQKRLTSRITQDQMEDKKPPHKIRQGLSMFMGTELTSDLKPQNIQAAQAVFASKNSQNGTQQGPSQPKKKSNPSSLSKSESSFLTGEQARERRLQKV